MRMFLLSLVSFGFGLASTAHATPLQYSCGNPKVKNVEILTVNGSGLRATVSIKDDDAEGTLKYNPLYTFGGPSIGYPEGYSAYDGIGELANNQGKVHLIYFMEPSLVKGAGGKVFFPNPGNGSVYLDCTKITY